MDPNASERHEPLPEATIRRLGDLRNSLLHLHKALLDLEREDFEKRAGRVNSAELLQVVLNDPQFAWLRQISAAVVQIDEILSADEAPSGDEVQELPAQLRALFTASTDSDFREKYQIALQREPAVVMAHAKVMSLLRQEDSSSATGV